MKPGNAKQKGKQNVDTASHTIPHDPFWNLDDSLAHPDNDKIVASTSNTAALNEDVVPVHRADIENNNNRSPVPSNLVCNLEVKKRKGRTRIQRENNKALRNSGQSYTSQLGKFVPERKITALNPCRLKCSETLNEKDRLTCFNDYWKLGTRDRRAMFISSLISILPKKTQKTDPLSVNRDCYCKYKLVVNNQDKPICKECFCKTLGETKGFINVVIKKKKSSSIGIILPDERGRKPPKNKKTAEEILMAKNHILSFPSYKSPYGKKTNKKYLSSNLSISMMYRLYKENCSKPISLKLYARCFHELNLSFKKPSKHNPKMKITLKSN